MHSIKISGIGNKKFPVAEVMLLLVAIFWGTSYGLTKEVLALFTLNVASPNV